MVLRIVGQRLLHTLPTLFGVTVAIFFLVRLTGDPAAILLPPDATPDAVARFRAENGLDQPLLAQYGYFVRDLVTGDLGRSIRYQESVAGLIGDRLPATLELTAAALLLALAVGLLLGVLGGMFRGSWIDNVGRAIALAGQSIPTFYLGIILMLIFGVWLRALPTVGRSGLDSLILPAVTLAAYLVPLVLRVTRGAVLDEISRDYVRTARAKGMRERRVVGVHVSKPAVIPVLTVVGLQVGTMLGGAVVVETVFSWPGLGQLLVSSITTRDYPLVQGLVLFAAVAFILINLAVDMAYTVLDPRMRLR